MDDAEALRLTFLKDALIAEFETKASLWQAFQGAAIAAIPISGLGAFARQITSEALGLVWAAAAAVALLSAVVLSLNRRSFERDLRDLLKEVETFKRRGGR